MTDKPNGNLNENIEEEEEMEENIINNQVQEEYEEEGLNQGIEEDGPEFSVAFDIQINNGSFILLVGKTEENKLILRLVEKEDDNKPFYQNEFSLEELTEKNAFFNNFKNENDAIECIIKNLNESEKELENKEKDESLILKNKKISYNEKLFFPLDYNNINIIINDCYYPLLQCFQSFENVKILMFDIADKLEIYFNNDSFFSLNQKVPPLLEEFIEEEKILELFVFDNLI